MKFNVKVADCLTETRALLATKGRKAAFQLDPKVQYDYEIRCDGKSVRVTAPRVRNLLCAAGALQDACRAGRKIASQTVRSPFRIRLVEAWGPMHSHRYLPNPEYHEHTWHIRLRESEPGRVGTPDLDPAEVEMAILRFDRYCRLMASHGYTGVVLDDQDYLSLFDDYPQIYPPDSHYRSRHMQYRQMFKRLLAICESYDLEFYLFCQEVGHTPPMKEFIGEICSRNERLWELYRAKYDEIIAAFPEITGFMFKVADSSARGWYGHADMFRHTCPHCAKGDGVARVRTLLQKTHEIIVGKHGKPLLWRTWDVDHGIHVSAENQKMLFAGLGGPNTFPVLKFQEGDYQMPMPLHPAIGQMPNQIVEYQFKLEHDGHGAMPLCIGSIFEKSLRKNAEAGIAGIWGWPMGGGKSSANRISYSKGFTRFIEMNEFVFSRLMMSPERSHLDAMSEWGALNLGPGNGKAVADLFTAAAEAFERLYYFGEVWTGPKRHNFLTMDGRRVRNEYFNRWWFNWHQLYLGGAANDVEQAEKAVRERVLPNLRSLPAAVRRLTEGAEMFHQIPARFVATVKKRKGYEEQYVAMWHHLQAADAFASVCALYVEAQLRFFSGKYSRAGMLSLCQELEDAKLRYDKLEGVYVTQILEIFLNIVRRKVAPTQ